LGLLIGILGDQNPFKKSSNFLLPISLHLNPLPQQPLEPILKALANLEMGKSAGWKGSNGIHFLTRKENALNCKWLRNHPQRWKVFRTLSHWVEIPSLTFASRSNNL